MDFHYNDEIKIMFYYLIRQYYTSWLCIHVLDQLNISTHKKSNFCFLNSIVGCRIIDFPGFYVYSATKHAEKVITEGIRRELLKEQLPIKVTVSFQQKHYSMRHARAKRNRNKTKTCRTTKFGISQPLTVLVVGGRLLISFNLF